MMGRDKPATGWKALRLNTQDRLWDTEAGYTTHERAIGQVLCRYAPNIFPSVETVAAVAGCSVRTAGKGLRVLCDGDRSRDLLPLFMRRHRVAEKPSGATKRHPGYEYEFVRSPEGLAVTRAGFSERDEAKRAAVLGIANVNRTRVRLSSETEKQAEKLRRQRAKAQGRQIIAQGNGDGDRLKKAQKDEADIQRKLEKLARADREIFAPVNPC